MTPPKATSKADPNGELQSALKALFFLRTRGRGRLLARAQGVTQERCEPGQPSCIGTAPMQRMQLHRSELDSSSLAHCERGLRQSVDEVNSEWRRIIGVSANARGWAHSVPYSALFAP